MHAIRKWVIPSALMIFTVGMIEPIGAEDVRSISISAEGHAAVSGILSGSAVEAKPDAQFVKLSIVFEQPLVLSRISIDSCGQAFKDSAEFSFFPGWTSQTVEGGKNVMQLPIEQKPPVRSIGINFRGNSGLCLHSLKVFDGNGKIVDLKTKPGLPSKVGLGEQDKRRDRFAGSGMIGVLDREWSSSEEGNRWMFRLRSDGTFFIRGFSEDYSEAHLFSATGSYRVTGSREGMIRVQLMGSKFVTPHPWDGSACPQDCSESGEAAGSPVKDEIEFDNIKHAEVMVRNRTVRKLRTLPFSDLRAHKTSLEE